MVLELHSEWRLLHVWKPVESAGEKVLSGYIGLCVPIICCSARVFIEGQPEWPTVLVLLRGI